MWKVLIFSSIYILQSFAFKLGRIECSVAPEAQPDARIHCDGAKNACEITCLDGFKFPHGETSLNMTCINNSRWIVSSYGNLPECHASCSPACLNGATCISPDRCACRPNFTGFRCQEELKVNFLKKILFKCLNFVF